jgi:hypothetical protein
LCVQDINKANESCRSEAKLAVELNMELNRTNTRLVNSERERAALEKKFASLEKERDELLKS